MIVALMVIVKICQILSRPF